MPDVRELEVLPPEGRDIVQTDTMTIAKAIAENVASTLATAPGNASEMVKAIDVECVPVITYQVSVRLELR
ncbi:hypothetical protein [Maridesulfovibrio sp.]|uniref:hypothetical protein n=1 Tax=unclassified Maridesulfovibrio TaxID=2794999 RepID=UPI003B00D5FF